jgi:hypothetical protein
LKLDVGFKSLLRGMRKHLKHIFDPEEENLRPGKHHWDTARWYREAESFLKIDLKLGSVSKKDVWATALLLYPALGPSKKFNCDQAILDNLGP